MTKCPKCFCNESDQNNQGVSVCVNCGTILEDFKMDNGVQFNDNQLVGDKVHIFQDNNQQYRGYKHSTTENIITSTLNQLKENLQIEDQYLPALQIAHNLLKLALQCSYQKCRIVDIGAALYFAFRSLKAPYLLLDISIRLPKCKVTKLARAYLKLLRFLSYEVFEETNILSQVQTIDPSIYVPRFIKNLGLVENQQEIIFTTCKLLKRMSIDWMAYGRRPSSLCGAAILIAAKFHGYDINTQDVCQTVLIGDETIRKRLKEFKKTQFASLTMEEFEQIKDVEKDVNFDTNDPPSFKVQKPLPLEQLQSMTLEQALQIERKNSVTNIRKEDEEIIHSSPKKIKHNEEVSEIDDKEAQQYLLNDEEQKLKQQLWNSMYSNWMQEQEYKRAILKKIGKKKIIRKPNAITDAEDPSSAIKEVFGQKMQKSVLKQLFSNEDEKIQIDQVPTDGDQFLKQIQHLIDLDKETSELLKAKKRLT